MARRRKGRRIHGIFLFDKPAGSSSNQVLQRVRRRFDAQKAGHTGTLDPLATGMLPICFGEATKLGGFLIDAHKGYETTLKLGEITDSADADGDVIERRDVPASLDRQRLKTICKQFLGDQMQIPPMVSAIKVNGQRLYKLAREGKTVEREPRAVTISHLQVLEFNGDVARLQVHCSKGTYIRSLVTDIGEKIGCGAHVTQLRRTFVAPFQGMQMWTEARLDDIEDIDSLLLPADVGLSHMPRVIADEVATAAFLHGQSIAAAILPGDSAGETPAESNPDTAHRAHLCRVYTEGGLLLGLAEADIEGRIAPRRVLQWDNPGYS